MSDQQVGDRLRRADPTPIASLHPDVPSDAVVAGEVTITWPFSIVTRSIAFRLAEPDFRKRLDKGQVRIDFHGPAGKAVADAALGGGDTVRIGLQGAAWDKPQTPTRPDTLEWQIRFTRKLCLQVVRAESRKEETIVVDAPETPADEEEPVIQPAIETPATPEPVTDTIPLPRTAGPAFPAKRPPSFDPEEEYASPAFIKRARVSYGSLFEGGLDLFEEEEEEKHPRRKRPRFSMHANWRYTSRTPSPEPEEPEEEEKEVDAQSGEDHAQTMVDEASQTQIAEQPVSIDLPSSPTPAAPSTQADHGGGVVFAPEKDGLESATMPQETVTEPPSWLKDAGVPSIAEAVREHEIGGIDDREITSHELAEMGIQVHDHAPEASVHNGAGPDEMAYTDSLQTPADYYTAPMDFEPPHHETLGFGHDLTPHAAHFAPSQPEDSSWTTLPPPQHPAHDPNDAHNPVEIAGSSSPLRQASPEPIQDLPVEDLPVEDLPAENLEPEEPPQEDDAPFEEEQSGDAQTTREQSEEVIDEDDRDVPGEDYDLRNYDSAQDDDIVEEDASADEDEERAGDPDEQAVDLEEESEQSEEEEEEEEEEVSSGPQPYPADELPRQPLSEEVRDEVEVEEEEKEEVEVEQEEEELEEEDDYERPLENGDYDEYDEGEEEEEEEGQDEEEQEEEEYDEEQEEEEEEEEESQAKAAAQKDPVFISLLSDSEDEGEEEEDDAKENIPPPVQQELQEGPEEEEAEEVSDAHDAHSEDVAEQLEAQPQPAEPEVVEQEDEHMSVDEHHSTHEPADEPMAEAPASPEPNAEGDESDASNDMEIEQGEDMEAVDLVPVPAIRVEEAAEEVIASQDNQTLEESNTTEQVEDKENIDTPLQDDTRDASKTQEQDDAQPAADAHKETTEQVQDPEGGHLPTPDETQDESVTVAAPETQADTAAAVMADETQKSSFTLIQNQTQQDSVTVQDDEPEEDYSLAASQQIMAESQAYGESQSQQNDEVEMQEPEAEKPEAGTQTQDTAHEPSSETADEVLITVQSLRSRDRRHSVDSARTDEDPSLAVAAQTSPRVIVQDIEKPGSPPSAATMEDPSSSSVRETRSGRSRTTRSAAKNKEPEPSQDTEPEPSREVEAQPPKDEEPKPSKGKGSKTSKRKEPKRQQEHHDSPPTVRVTRSKKNEEDEVDEGDVSVQMARATRARPQTPERTTRQTRGTASPETTRQTRAASQRLRSKTPEPKATNKEELLASPLSTAGSTHEDDEQTRTIKRKLTQELRTKLGGFLPLKNLRGSVNKSTDLMGVVTTTPPRQPRRPRGGPRDYMLEVLVTDQGAAPSTVCVVHILRPHQASLPTVQAGDVVLLRQFHVVAMKDRGFGARSGDDSAWAVFEGKDDEMLPQIRGPPVEISQDEAAHAEGLRRWWGLLDGKIRDKLDKTMQRMMQAGEE